LLEVQAWLAPTLRGGRIREEDGTVRLEKTATEREGVELDAEQARGLTSTFAAPGWLQDLGRTSWLLVGLFVLLAGIAWVLGTASTIVGPVVAASIVATVAMPLVGILTRHHLPRAAGAAVVLLLLAAIAALLVVVVIAGITGQHAAISEDAGAAAIRIKEWLKSLGVSQSGASGATASLETDVPKIISTLTVGVIHGIQGITSVVFGLSLALLSTFFLLKDGPSMRRWVDGHLGVPRPVGQTITGGVVRSLRGYFRGVTIIAAFNGVVVGLGALVIGVPLAGTIGVVTFVTAYVPFIGAFVAGAFAVVIALGAQGTSTALIMLVIVLLANGLLQNILQPFAMGASLDLNPLVVLIVTIGAGALFGMIGLVLAAPLTSAAVHIMRDLSAARERAESVSSAAGEADPQAQPLASPAVHA
jgi:predicted PurR-regulated permease PerM